MNKIIRVFLDTDMRCQHPGLVLIAAKEGIKLDALEQNEHALFLNKFKNKVKIYSHNKVLSYMRHDKGKLDLMALQEIPKTFATKGHLDFDAAIKKSLLTRIERKNK